MIKVTETFRRDPLALIQEALDKVVLASADKGGDALRRNISAGARSGVHYPSLPRRSSSPSEYSQEQSGRLVGMVESGSLGQGQAFFGLVPRGRDEEEQALAQEFGAPKNNLAARANVRRTALDARTRAEMVEAGKSAAR